MVTLIVMGLGLCVGFYFGVKYRKQDDIKILTTMTLICRIQLKEILNLVDKVIYILDSQPANSLFKVKNSFSLESKTLTKQEYLKELQTLKEGYTKFLVETDQKFGILG